MRSIVLSSLFWLTCVFAQQPQPSCPSGQSGGGIGGVFACCSGIMDISTEEVVCITGCEYVIPACAPDCSESPTGYTSGICTSSTVTLDADVASATTYVTTVLFPVVSTTTSTSSTTSSMSTPTPTTTSHTGNAVPLPTAAPVMLLGAMAMALI